MVRGQGPANRLSPRHSYALGIPHTETRPAVSQNVYFKVCSILRLFLSSGHRRLPAGSPARRHPAKAAKARDPRVFTQDEIGRLADVVKRENARDWAIFLLLPDTGIRATELCSLSLSDVHNERQEPLELRVRDDTVYVINSPQA
jgi:integrase